MKVVFRSTLEDFLKFLLTLRILEIPASQVFIGADARLLVNGVEGSKMPLSCLKSQLKLTICNSAVPPSDPASRTEYTNLWLLSWPLLGTKARTVRKSLEWL